MHTHSKQLLALALGCGLMFPTLGAAHEDHAIAVPQFARSGQQMTTAATGFLNSLSEEQRSAAVFEFVNDADRTHWSNAPVSSVERIGLPISRLTLAQRGLLHQLLVSSTSSQGYHKIWAAVRGDEALKAEGENLPLESAKFVDKNNHLGAANYWLAFFGDPSTESSWGYMLTGHHLGANFTVVDGKATFVPMFYGSDPAVISTGAQAGHVFLPQERNRGYELLSSLSADQRRIAVVADKVVFNKFGAVEFAGPGTNDRVVEQRGIKAADLTQEQRSLMWALVEEFVGNSDFDVAADHLAKIKHDGMENLRFMWMGPTDGSEQIFYRVSGPSILIDFVDQRTGFDWNTHPHVIVRDPSNDYGTDWLQRHISESH